MKNSTSWAIIRIPFLIATPAAADDDVPRVIEIVPADDSYLAAIASAADVRNIGLRVSRDIALVF